MNEKYEINVGREGSKGKPEDVYLFSVPRVSPAETCALHSMYMRASQVHSLRRMD